MAKKNKKSTPYDADFEQHLKDHDAQAVYESQKPTNWAEIGAALNQRRPSLTLSQFSEGAFDAFQNNNARATSEYTVMTDVVPVILGEGALITGRPASERNILFNNVAPLTDGTIAQPKPDIYYGTRPEELSRPVREALGRYIMPSTVQNKPLAPNFFIEAKGPDGTLAVLDRQVRYDGAIGSRAMHSLQNYGEDERTFDGQAYSFSSTYHGGTLKIFAHHATSSTSEGRPAYHITKMHGFDMTNTRETFVQGATALRNARDLAKTYRDGFIHTANERAVSQPSGILEAIEEGDEQDDGDREEADKTRKPTTALADEAPVASTTSSVAKKETKRKHPAAPPEVSVPLTRAAKRRLCFSGKV
ncbi:hypothetical protein SPBR_05126 [Sporothrix brasiliensis 5110]|uniref:DUF7924 domain-containing protein n=1 Tax=Sporothrix brasiliensis 5110 TaxID=1398154 RepID=A0A0C2F8C6_9PEZI|nr:uncharacterized protein SPBR_05126 [Sporothrix brasiliensis 5110]KIH87298.1 hypothetical protein SPBR_05126 [Sporothrix brasiliensis 5110]